MKGFFSGIAVTAPVTALLIYVVMSGRAATIARIERAQIHQQILEEQFDSDFDQTWHSLSMSDQELEERQNARKVRLAHLREKERQFDEQFDQQFNQTQNDVEDFRDILSSSPMPAKERK